MTVAILGTGSMAKGLVTRLKGKADLVIGSREAGKSVAGIAAVTYADAVAKADLVIVAIPYDPAIAIIKSLDLAGKVVVDMTNPLKPDFSSLALGFTTSAAEELQKLAPAAHVVKAYNTVFAALFDADTSAIPVFIAGDDKAATEKVAALVTQSGFKADIVGGLDAARLIEPLGMLNIKLGYHLGRGTRIAPAWVAA